MPLLRKGYIKIMKNIPKYFGKKTPEIASGVFMSSWSPVRPGPKCCNEDDLPRDPSSETI